MISEEQLLKRFTNAYNRMKALNAAQVLHQGKTAYRLLEEFVWWSLVPGESIMIPWPTDPPAADPNYHYRPFLEENVGKQGWAWEWRLADNGDSVQLKFRLGRTSYAPICALMWS
jgi:hypothetical protein